jgi:hypothetical protein
VNASGEVGDSLQEHLVTNPRGLEVRENLPNTTALVCSL